MTISPDEILSILSESDPKTLADAREAYINIKEIVSNLRLTKHEHDCLDANLSLLQEILFRQT